MDTLDDTPFQILQRCLVVSLPKYLDCESREELGQMVIEQAHRYAVLGVVIDISRVDVLDDDDMEWLQTTMRTCAVIGSPAILSGMTATVAGAIVQFNTRIDGVHAANTLESAIATLYAGRT